MFFSENNLSMLTNEILSQSLTKFLYFSYCSCSNTEFVIRDCTRRINYRIYKWLKDYRMQEFIFGSNKLAQFLECFYTLLESFEIKLLTGDFVRRGDFVLPAVHWTKKSSKTNYFSYCISELFLFCGSF